MTTEQKMSRIERSLNAILRSLQNVDGNFEAVDDMSRTALDALDMLAEMKLDAQPACEEIPEGVVIPEGAVLVTTYELIKVD